jgi:hypothetical protein
VQIIRSYKILAPAEMDAEPNPKIATEKCLASTTLDPDFYRIGHTKASDFMKFIFMFRVSNYLKFFFRICLKILKFQFMSTQIQTHFESFSRSIVTNFKIKMQLSDSCTSRDVPWEGSKESIKILLR